MAAVVEKGRVCRTEAQPGGRQRFPQGLLSHTGLVLPRAAAGGACGLRCSPLPPSRHPCCVLATAPRINMAAAAREGSPAGRAGSSGMPADTGGSSAMSALPGFDSPDAFVKVRSERGRGSGGGTTAPGVLCALGPCREL